MSPSTISEKQLAANRTNAQLSTGPKTEQGKCRSSLNARRHGFTGQITLMTDEDRAAYAQFCAAIVDGLAPATGLEHQLAQSIAEDSWRLNRMRAVESNVFALGLPAAEATAETDDPAIQAAMSSAQVFMADPRSFQLLTLYIQRTSREIQKNTALLRQMQTERKAQLEQDLKVARPLRRLNEMKGLPYDPAADGFDFSTTEIDRSIRQERRLHEARIGEYRRWDRDAYLQSGGTLAA